MSVTQATDRRRRILDAAVRVFARKGFHATRVGDIAREAGVAYGLLYHYFQSKDEVLDTLFQERWTALLEMARAVEGGDMPPREKLHAIAAFVVDSYAHDPNLMKVIVVEVTRAANSFGRRHLAPIAEANGLVAEIICAGQARGELRADVDAEFAAVAFYGVIEQVLTAWIFGLLPADPPELEAAKDLIVETVYGGLAAAAAADLID